MQDFRTAWSCIEIETEVGSKGFDMKRAYSSGGHTTVLHQPCKNKIVHRATIKLCHFCLDHKKIEIRE